MALTQATYGVAAAAIAADDGPTHGPLVRPEIAAVKDAAVDCNSAATPFQAAAAANMGPAPGPLYIRPELISGGKAA
ncbi:hypothetical protein MPRG_26060 [Mycobacterium paragordonae]|uniref:Uncharacterized protein n=1 Tax=Mycobacterium paragordonae TaxID=1389713 RepID=A0ABQ1C4F0_9MYCO|nr:hypothetical protein MPRG_26060 [Mycobacterium paragordonae]